MYPWVCTARTVSHVRTGSAIRSVTVQPNTGFIQWHHSHFCQHLSDCNILSSAWINSTPTVHAYCTSTVLYVIVRSIAQRYLILRRLSVLCYSVQTISNEPLFSTFVTLGSADLHGSYSDVADVSPQKNSPLRKTVTLATVDTLGSWPWARGMEMYH